MKGDRQEYIISSTLAPAVSFFLFLWERGVEKFNISK
jgi:hypothetical protein